MESMERVMQIELSSDELDLLRQLLEAKRVDLQHEIHHTDDREFKAALKARRDLLEALLSKLR